MRRPRRTKPGKCWGQRSSSTVRPMSCLGQRIGGRVPALMPRVLGYHVMICRSGRFTQRMLPTGCPFPHHPLDHPRCDERRTMFCKLEPHRPLIVERLNLTRFALPHVAILSWLFTLRVIWSTNCIVSARLCSDAMAIVRIEAQGSEVLLHVTGSRASIKKAR